MKAHTANQVRSANSELRCNSSIRHFLSIDATNIFVSAFVLSCLEIPSCLAVSSISQRNHRKFKPTLLALSWEFPKLSISLILLLSIGCPLIHAYSTNSFLCARTASTRPFLSTWLNVLKFTNQHCIRSSFDTFILCLPSVLTHSLGQKSFFMLHRLSGTVSLAKLDHH